MSDSQSLRVMPRNQETTNSCCSRFKSTWALAWEQTLTISVDEAGVNVGILEFWQCPGRRLGGRVSNGLASTALRSTNLFLTTTPAPTTDCRLDGAQLTMGATQNNASLGKAYSKHYHHHHKEHRLPSPPPLAFTDSPDYVKVSYTNHPSRQLR